MSESPARRHTLSALASKAQRLAAELSTALNELSTILSQLSVPEGATQSENARIIINQVAAKHGLSAEDIAGGRRLKPIAEARKEAARRLRLETDMSWAKIGPLLGRKSCPATSEYFPKGHLAGLPPAHHAIKFLGDYVEQLPDGQKLYRVKFLDAHNNQATWAPHLPEVQKVLVGAFFAEGANTNWESPELAEFSKTVKELYGSFEFERRHHG